MVCATSAVVPSRPSGTWASTNSAVPGERMAVLISPGAMALARTPRGPNSCASSRVSAASAAFEVA